MSKVNLSPRLHRLLHRERLVSAFKQAVENTQSGSRLLACKGYVFEDILHSFNLEEAEEETGVSVETWKALQTKLYITK